MTRVEVRADLSGTVTSVEVNPGQHVTDGDPIIVMESMKMEIPVTSARPGRVLEISVREGDTVTEGQLLALIDV